jgi:starch synthase
VAGVPKRSVMKVLYISPEVHPFAKTGGLADVAASLPASLARAGHEVKIVMPHYGSIDSARWKIEPRGAFKVHLSLKVHTFTCSIARLPGAPVEVLFLGNEALFNRPGIYQEPPGRDYPDNLERFSAFCRAVLEIPGHLDWIPDIIHGNDWQSALAFAYWRAGMKAMIEAKAPQRKIGTVFTIHNLGYPGLFPAETFDATGLSRDYFTPETLEFFGRVNLMKGGLLFADALSTVSPTYSREIQTPEFGYGLDGVLRKRRSDLHGIINGVDYAEWDPSVDQYIPNHYDARRLDGKRRCKEVLQDEVGLPKTFVPLLGMVTRLTVQKGVDLLIEVLDELMLLDIQIVLLGEGDSRIHEQVSKAAERYPEKFAFHSKFDIGLSHRIQAGSDLYLMPSRYEPCGLAQLYSQRYGTLPIVHQTGGLADTVVDALPSAIAAKTATGFVFSPARGANFLNAIRLALAHYRDRTAWTRLVKTAMAADFSWGRSVEAYAALYAKSLVKA